MKKCVWCDNMIFSGTFCQECLDECYWCWNETDDFYCKECSDYIKTRYVGMNPPKWEPELELIEEGDEWKHGL